MNLIHEHTAENIDEDRSPQSIGDACEQLKQGLAALSDNSSLRKIPEAQQLQTFLANGKHLLQTMLVDKR